MENWIKDRASISDAARKAQEKAHQIERKRKRKGWRWVKVDVRTKVLVPCNGDGTPTAEGQRIISEVLERL